MSIHKIAVAVAVLLGSTLDNCEAHFLWLASSEGKALVFFGENTEDRDYHMPASLGSLRLNHRTTDKNVALRLIPVEEDQFVGMVSQEALSKAGVIETTCQYGVYHGTLLTYHAKHYLSADSLVRHKIKRSKTQQLDIVPEAVDGDDVTLRIFWKKKPATGISVSLIHADGPVIEQTTDGNGRTTFHDVPGGLTGILASHIEKNHKGNIDGKQYDTASHFATATFQHHGESQSSTKVQSQRAARRPRSEVSLGESVMNQVISLPVAVASFGAAESKNYLYVYGGHIGEAHVHSRDNLSQHFSRLSLTINSQWEDLPFERPLQGLSLVSHKGFIYRIGGLTAKNALGEEDDLHSVADFSRYDPKSATWKTLPSLPSPRSSHDAVIIGDKIFIAGGWNLSGGDHGDWHTNGLVMDLATKPLAWEKLPIQPFQRRALAAASLNGKLIVIGGIDSEGEVSRNVDVFNPETAVWSKGVSYPGKGMNGFGVSAWNLGGKVYASGSNGTVYCLNKPRGPWKSVGQLKQPRFFHRLMPGPAATLFVMGGASNVGHLRNIEIFKPSAHNN